LLNVILLSTVFFAAKKTVKTSPDKKKTKKTIDIAGIIWKEAYNIRLTADAKI